MGQEDIEQIPDKPKEDDPRNQNGVCWTQKETRQKGPHRIFGIVQ